MRSRRVFRLLAPVLAASLLLLQPADARAQSLTDLKKEETEAKRAADQAAAEVTDAIGRWNEIHHEIETTKANIAVKQAKADELGTLAIDRAVEAYKGSNFEVAEVFESTDLLEASRRARLLGEVTRKDSEAINRLEVEAVDLKTEQEKLDGLLDEAQGILDARRAAEARLEQRFEQLASKRKALEARLAAQSRAQSASASGGGGGGGPAPAPVGGLVCPFPGSSFTDSWGAPRSGGRSHKGVDMMGPHGAPLYSVTGGTVTHRSGGLAGRMAFLRGDDGNLYFYAHLSSFGAGGRVGQGTVIGYNGSTGNASGGAPHLHFEIKLGGVRAVNPYPTTARIC